MKIKSSGIYQIKNIINNKVYIGSTININNRWKEHKNDLKTNKHSSILLQRSYNKYSKANFEFSILEEIIPVTKMVKFLFKDLLLKREQHYLDLYQSYNPDKGYNICKIAGSCLGVKRSKEIKENLSLSHKGKKKSEEHKLNIGKAHLGKKRKPFTKEHIKNLCLAKERQYNNGYIHPMTGKISWNNGLHHTDEAKHNISLRKIGVKASDNAKENMSIAKKKLYAEGYISPMKDKHFTKESIELMRLAKLGKKRKPFSNKARQNMQDAWIIRRQNKNL